MRRCYQRNEFFGFVLWSAKESDKVENYRFTENCSIEFEIKLGLFYLTFRYFSAEKIDRPKIENIDFMLYYKLKNL